MAIQIIQRGVLPAAVRYKTECRHCNTIFSFLKSDACFTDDQRESYVLQMCSFFYYE